MASNAAQPITARPISAQPAALQPTTAQPSTFEPTAARPSTAARPTTAAKPAAAAKRNPNVRTSLVGIDLSSAGARREWRREGNEETEKFLMGRLAGLAALADKAGVDFIALDESFHAAGLRRRDDWLDGAVAASRLARHTKGARLISTVPISKTGADHVGAAIASVHRASAGRAGWQLGEGEAVSAKALDQVRGQWQDREPRPQVIVPVRNAAQAELAGARADIARVRVATKEEAIKLRAVIREAAVDWGRNPDDVAVVVDVFALISADAASAHARWDLLTSLEEEPKRYPLRSIGTATDLADLWSAWVHSGAADGFTLIPASIPTDVAALAGQIIPEIERRGLRKARYAAQGEAAPSPARSAARSKTRTRVAARP